MSVLRVVVTTYNAGAGILEQCLESIAAQTHRDFRVWVVDDASTCEVEETSRLLAGYRDRFGWGVTHHRVNEGSLSARHTAICSFGCRPDDIMVVIDGDDYLYDRSVLQRVSEAYHRDPELLVAFGNSVDLIDGKLETELQIDPKAADWEEIIRTNGYRDQWLYSHLMTFKYSLYAQVDPRKQFYRDGRFIRCATDQALMYPLLELAAGRFRCATIPTYVYRGDHPLSLHMTAEGRDRQVESECYIRNRIPRLTSNLSLWLEGTKEYP